VRDDRGHIYVKDQDGELRAVEGPGDGPLGDYASVNKQRAIEGLITFVVGGLVAAGAAVGRAVRRVLPGRTPRV
jgi:hypothetical protein